MRRISKDLSAQGQYILMRNTQTKPLSEVADGTTVSVKAYLYDDFEGLRDPALYFSTADGCIYATTSKTFIEEFFVIADTFEEVGDIVILKRRSKSNRVFSTCYKNV